jgi:hypothetical protein
MRHSWRIIENNSPTYSTVEDWWAACEAIQNG